MLTKVEFRVTTALGALAVGLALLNMALFVTNRRLQADVASRSQYIQQSTQLQTLYQEIVKALADLSVRNKDEQLKELLNREGITVSVSPPGTGAAAPAGGKGRP